MLLFALQATPSKRKRIHSARTTSFPGNKINSGITGTDVVMFEHTFIKLYGIFCSECLLRVVGLVSPTRIKLGPGPAAVCITRSSPAHGPIFGVSPGPRSALFCMLSYTSTLRVSWHTYVVNTIGVGYFLVPSFSEAYNSFNSNNLLLICIARKKAVSSNSHGIRIIGQYI